VNLFELVIFIATCLKVARLAYLTPNFTNLAFFEAVGVKNNCLAFWLFLYNIWLFWSSWHILFGFLNILLKSSGVFNGRRARHLPRPPLFWGPPLRYYVHKFSLFLVKDILFTHVMCYKANHQQVFCFQRAPYRNCNVQVLCFQRSPQQQFSRVSALLSKEPPTVTVICKYLAFTGAPNSNCNV